jgi:hypothetical protein
MKIIETNNQHEWRLAVHRAGFSTRVKYGVGEDPFTYFTALRYISRGNSEVVGYFGDSNGQDADYGVLFSTGREYQRDKGKAA